MAQPVKKNIENEKKKTVKTKKTTDKRLPQKTKSKKKFVKRKHPEYGTSKLEEKFAKNFLDKLNVEYTTQFKAEDIGRYYDFCIWSSGRPNILIEIDGNFFHGRGLTFEEKNPMQKHSEIVDKIKDRWAALHGIPLYRIWEEDINKNPEKVMNFLKEILYIDNKKKEMNKRH